MKKVPFDQIFLCDCKYLHIEYKNSKHLILFLLSQFWRFSELMTIGIKKNQHFFAIKTVVFEMILQN